MSTITFSIVKTTDKQNFEAILKAFSEAEVAIDLLTLGISTPGRSFQGTVDELKTDPELKEILEFNTYVVRGFAVKFAGTLNLSIKRPDKELYSTVNLDLTPLQSNAHLINRNKMIRLELLLRTHLTELNPQDSLNIFGAEIHKHYEIR